VLIIDFIPRGHHPFYVRLLLDSGLAQLAQVTLAAPKEMFQHPAIAQCTSAFRQHRIVLGSDATPEQSYPIRNGLPGPAGVILRSWALGRLYRRVYRAVAREGALDFVIVPYLDDCLLGLSVPRATFGATPWLAITMRTMLHFDAMGVTAPAQSFTALRRLLIHRILRQQRTRALLTIDPTLAEFAAAQPDPIFRKIRYVPDPATHHAVLPSRAEARQRLDIPDDARVVLLYGAIHERKGASLLVQAAAAAQCSSRVHLIIAGRFFGLQELERGDAWRALETQRRIHPFNGFVDQRQEGLMLAATDCMWVGYIDFYGVSSVMALAGLHGIPVLASDYGLVGYFTRKYGLGATLTPNDQSSVIAALNLLVSDPEFFLRAGGHGVTTYRQHSPEVLQRVVRQTVADSWI
jgi:glycosyltransferase involved in cell wall biosynthesis